MKDKFIEVLRESNELWQVQDYRPRSIGLPDLPGKATALIGVRRAGKSTLLKQIAQSYLADRGFLAQQILFINFSDERLAGVQASDLGALLEAQHHIFASTVIPSPMALFLDEIQLVQGWELFVDRLLRNRAHQVFISGSSAKLLSTEIATEMRGRAISVEVFPFSFREVCAFRAWPTRHETAEERGKLSALVASYVREGGFPEIQEIAPNLQKQILQEYLDVLLLRDVIERHPSCNPAIASALIRLSLGAIAAPCTFTKLSSRLRSMGLSASPGAIGEYFEWFKDCYLFWLVPIFSESVHKQNTNPRKLYCIDSGFISATNIGISDKLGSLLENTIFVALRASRSEIYYYRTGSGKEVDFIYRAENTAQQWRLVQVAHSLADERTKRREVEALIEACKEVALQEGTIITADSEETFEQDGVKIFILPVAKLLLSAG